MELNCYLIEPAERFLKLLAHPITTYYNNSKNLYPKWKFNFIDLFNNRNDFLCMAQTRVKRRKSQEQKIINTNFYENYEILKTNMMRLSRDLNLWNNTSFINDDHIVINLEDLNNTPKNDDLLCEMMDKEEIHKRLIHLTMFRFIVFLFQYVNIFEERSISNNLWNYSLRSTHFSYRCFFIGIITLLIQYIWIGALLYSVIEDYSATNNLLIIIISILSTILSLLYSLNSIKSYLYTRYLYKFLINVYNDFPEIYKSNNERDKVFYKERNITMKKYHLKYNWWADFFSNFILPLCIPITNFFIILNSESIIDAILNSVAIFFIVQIDEDLYTFSEFDCEKNTINFTRWMTSIIYCHYFPLFKDIYQLECEKWFSKLFRISKTSKLTEFKIKQMDLI